MMGREEIGSERVIGHNVKAAVGWFGERFSEGNSSINKTHMHFSQKQSPRTREVHIPEEVSELSIANKMVRDLTLKIEQSNTQTKLRVQELEKQKHQKQSQDQRTLVSRKTDDLMRDLEKVEQDLSKLKLEVSSILEEKKRAEDEAKSSNSKIDMYSKSLDTLAQEIEEITDEQVLVELAQIEASKELEEIQARREEEAQKFLTEIEIAKREKKQILEEIDKAKELEMKLSLTKHDIEMLENQVKTAKEMDTRVSSFRKENEIDLKSVIEELELAKNELASIREESFQLMAAMDEIRNEFVRVSEKAAFLKKRGEKADQKVHILNLKLLKAKEELEVVSSSEEKAKAIAENVFLACEHVKTELEASKREKELIFEKTTNLKTQIDKNKVEKKLAEMKLEATIQELEEAKSSEFQALEKLKSFAEKAMKDRAFALEHSSTITISEFEYKYLTSRAAEAEDVADKKVAAAHAWIEALKANEKEIRVKTEIEKESRENWDEISEVGSSEFGGEIRRKSMKKSGGMTPGRRAKLRIPASPVLRNARRLSSVNIKM